MLEKPKTYVEAKRILQSQADDEIATYRKRAMKRDFCVEMLVGLGLWALGAIVIKDWSFILTLLILLIIWFSFIIVSFIFGYFTYVRDLKKIRDGSAFKGMREEDTIEAASKYVDYYNKAKEEGFI